MLELRSIRYSYLKHLGSLFIALACFVIVGGHWWMLQGVAWGKMFYSFYTTSESPNLTGALKKTFSPHYRCPLCKKIARAKQESCKKNGYKISILKKRKNFLISDFLPIESPPSSQYDYFLSRNKEYQEPVLVPPAPYPKKPSYFWS